jgi:hypothetical protein
MEIVATYSATTMVFTDPTGEPWETADVYQLLRCPACRAVTLRSYFWHEGIESEAELNYKTLYPSDSRIPLGLPPEIATEFLAATRVRVISANAYGVLLGRVMEMVCRDRNATGKFLGQKLADLAAKGEIPTKLVDVAKSLTALRNVGAHADLGELTPQEVPILEDLCKAVLDYVYSAPFLVQKAQDALNKLKAKPKVMKPIGKTSAA